jgi:hypothetical protein
MTRGGSDVFLLANELKCQRAQCNDSLLRYFIFLSDFLFAAPATINMLKKPGNGTESLKLPSTFHSWYCAASYKRSAAVSCLPDGMTRTKIALDADWELLHLDESLPHIHGFSSRRTASDNRG